jgi:CheY-like chemotaxis protein
VGPEIPIGFEILSHFGAIEKHWKSQFGNQLVFGRVASASADWTQNRRRSCGRSPEIVLQQGDPPSRALERCAAYGAKHEEASPIAFNIGTVCMIISKKMIAKSFSSSHLSFRPASTRSAAPGCHTRSAKRKSLENATTVFSSTDFEMKTILLIDDCQQVRTAFRLALRTNGYHVIEADSGAAGLEIARQHLPDLILTDIHMPGGDGSSLLRHIRGDAKLKSSQVVLMTGRPDLVTPRKGMEEGADDFLVKPIGLESLLNCVKARLSRASISWRVEDQMLDQLRSWVPPHLPHEFFTPLAGIIG